MARGFRNFRRNFGGASKPFTVISGSQIVDTAHKKLVSTVPSASYYISKDWWPGKGTSTTPCSAAAWTCGAQDDDVEERSTASLTINLNEKCIGKTCTMTYDLYIYGRWGGSGAYLRAYNGNQALVNYVPEYMWSGSARFTRTDTFVIQNGVITLGAQYDATSKKWGPGASVECKELIIQ